MGVRYTDLDKKRIIKAVGDVTGGKFTEGSLKNPKALKAFKDTTGRDVTNKTLYNLIQRIQDPEKFARYRMNAKNNNGVVGKKKKKENKFKVFNSNFVLIIEGVGLYGFNDEDSLKKAIEKMDSVAMIGRAVHLFSKRKVKVECKII